MFVNNYYLTAALNSEPALKVPKPWILTSPFFLTPFITFSMKQSKKSIIFANINGFTYNLFRM